jgi:hypothetical protein
MNNYYLVISTLGLLFPLAIFVMNTHKNNYEKGLAFLLLINLVISFLFWLNPIQNSWIHFYDGLFGKISYLLFSIYILFIKKLEQRLKLVFLFILVSSFYAFYCSNSKSSNSWCCEEHILYHSTFHILISLGTAFAFF